MDGGKLNSVTNEDLVEVITLRGKEWLHYAAPVPNVCFIRATTADADGNLSLELEAARLEVLPIAQAVRNAGGTVIAQVKRVAAAGSLDLRLVAVPDFCVDVVVVNPQQRQLLETEYNPALSGEVKGANVTDCSPAAHPSQSGRA